MKKIKSWETLIFQIIVGLTIIFMMCIGFVEMKKIQSKLCNYEIEYCNRAELLEKLNK
jgi:hypothetical protein